jgi:thiamine biosynthesis lipoprotein
LAEPGPRPRASASLPIRTRVLLPLLLLLLGYASVRLYGRVPTRPVVELSGAALGTTWSVKLAVAELDAAGRRVASGEVTARLQRVDELMSTWRDDSELARFNARATLEPFAIARETGDVVSISLAVSARSHGALDVTVGPLVDAWGFGRPDSRGPPGAKQLAKLREAVGWQRLALAPDQRTLAKGHPALRVDLSAVAKGYAVDEIARGLAGLGYRDFLVEVGGELRAQGRHLDDGPWRVAIEAPDSPERQIHRIVELRDSAMATSGDYRNFYQRDGRRFSHTIDPRTGRPIEHALASVTVLHPEAAWADAWATALHVLGPTEGYALAASEQLAAYFIVRQADGFEVRLTPAFAPRLAADGREAQER